MARPASAAAASRTVPSPPTTTTSGASRSTAASAARASPRGRRPRPAARAGPLPDGAPMDAVDDPVDAGRIGEPRRPGIDEDERRRRIVGSASAGRGGSPSRRCVARGRRAVAGTIPAIAARLRSPTDPQVRREPGKHEERPDARLARALSPATSHSCRQSSRPGHPGSPSVLSVRARGRHRPRRRAPARRAGRKEHHCARYTLGARAFIPPPSQGLILSPRPVAGRRRGADRSRSSSPHRRRHRSSTRRTRPRRSTVTSTPTPTRVAARPPRPRRRGRGREAGREAEARGTEAQQIIRIARTTLGRPWRYGAHGPCAFDCSGLVIYAFKRAGDGRAVANGHLRSARALYQLVQGPWPREPTQPEDRRPRHLGPRHATSGSTSATARRSARSRAASRSTACFAVTARFTAYLHTGMWKKPVR